MAEIVVNNEVCKACGADVREGSLFCYNCGGSLAPEIVVTEKDKISDNGRHENISETVDAKDDLRQTEQPPENNADLYENAPKVAEEAMTKTDAPEEINLKSAAALRKKPKTIQKKKIEIVWKEHENAPNMWFVIAAILLAVFTAVVLWLALYIR